MEWKVRGQNVLLERTLLMGVLNITPDSFSDGGLYLDPDQASVRAKWLIAEGADILDLGAESTRPGAEPVTLAEEAERLMPILDSLKSFGALISIDTTKPEIAHLALEKGAHIINDVSGLKDSGPEMAKLAKRYDAGLVLMHRRGNPETMASLSEYEDLIEEVKTELQTSIDLALSAGVHPNQIVIDPGLGFAKSAEANFQIIQGLSRFQSMGFPLMLGPSRKSFLGRATGRSVQEREYGTAACAAIAVFQGTHILRVHEPGGIRDAVRVAEAIRGVHHVRSF